MNAFDVVLAVFGLIFVLGIATAIGVIVQESRMPKEKHDVEAQSSKLFEQTIVEKRGLTLGTIAAIALGIDLLS
jgi:hypothetical protein